MKMRLIVTLVAAMCGLTACATSPSAINEAEVYDPFESFNRKIYGFNEAVDHAVIGPVARGYNNSVPEPARDGLHNALVNANSSVTFANDVLQAKPHRAAETFTRFLINTTIGLGGLFDVAGKSGLEGHTEDFGQTLGVWGVPMGPYFMSPFLGPSNLRDTVGGIVDRTFDPLTWVEFGVSDNLDLYLSGGRTVVTALDTRARFDPAITALRQQPEPYTALRRGYASGRRTAIRDGILDENPYEDLPDFDDFDDFDDE